MDVLSQGAVNALNNSLTSNQNLLLGKLIQDLQVAINDSAGGGGLPFGFIDESLLEGDSQIKLYFREDATLTGINIKTTNGDGPVGGDLEIDIRKDSDGLTILTGGVMKILDGEETGAAVPDVLSFSEGDILLVDINTANGLTAKNLFIDFK